MNITIIIDSFKGSLSSQEVANVICKSIKKINPYDKVKIIPIADGGEGTVDALSILENSEKINITTHSPSMEDVESSYLLIRKNNIVTAIIEMSSSSGICLKSQYMDHIKASSFGVGDQIKDALNNGARKFIIGLGGSATSDCGIGMLSSLGYKFFDNDNNEIYPYINNVDSISRIDFSKVDKRLKDCVFELACDVENPLTGKNGTAQIFSPQKGVTKQQIPELEKYIESFHKLTKSYFPKADKNYPGAGAAGGLGYAFKYYLNAKIYSGIDICLNLLNAEDFIKKSDLIITGEGKLDTQTSMGKTPIGIAKLAKKHNKKVIAISGVVENDIGILNSKGIDAFFPIINDCIPLEDAINRENTIKNLNRTTMQLFRLINLFN